MLQTLENGKMDDKTNEEKKDANELIERIKNNMKTTEESLKNLINKQNIRQNYLQKIKQKKTICFFNRNITTFDKVIKRN